MPARALFLSGAPRQHEEHAGVAFASPLSPWLEEKLAAAGVDPADVHYATLTGCRPPHQRPLRPDEIAACAPRLDLTIKAVEPRVIVLCGPDVVAALLPGVSLSGEHGTLVRRGHRRYYPLRHPYAAPHSERYVDEVMGDLRRLATLLDEGWPPAEDEDDSGEAFSATSAPLFAAPDTTRGMRDEDESAGRSTAAEAAAGAVAAFALPVEAVKVAALTMADGPTTEREELRGAGEIGTETTVATGATDDATAAVDSEDSPTQLSLF